MNIINTNGITIDTYAHEAKQLGLPEHAEEVDGFYWNLIPHHHYYKTYKEAVDAYTLLKQKHKAELKKQPLYKHRKIITDMDPKLPKISLALFYGEK